MYRPAVLGLIALFLLSLLVVLAPTALADESAADLGEGRLVLVPINLGVRPEAEVEPGIEPVWNEILQHFGGGERKVTALERTSAAVLWQDVMVEMERRRNKDVYAAYATFAKYISKQLDYETIVFPSLVTRAARIQGTTVAWDGVRRRIDSPLVKHEALRVLTGHDLVVAREGVRGEIAAASLHVAVLDADGKLRFEGAGGLTVLQDLVQGEVKGDTQLDVTLRDDAFADSEALREGIEVAFKRPLPASRAH